MSLYYDATRSAHEHRPSVPDKYKYLENERQWLLVKTSSSRIAFLRFQPIFIIRVRIPWPISMYQFSILAIMYMLPFIYPHSINNTDL